MPKDTSSSVPPQGEVRRTGQKPGALPRNNACAQCRKKKIRCDAARPACGKCVRTFQSLNPNQPRPAQPTCTYEDPSPSSLLPKERSPSTSSAEASSSAPYRGPTAPATPRGDANALELRVQQLEGMLKMAVGGGDPEALGRLAGMMNGEGDQRQPSGGGGGGAGIGVASSSASATGSSSFFVAAGSSQFGMDQPSRGFPSSGPHFSSEASNTPPPLASSSSANSSAYFPPLPPLDNQLQPPSYQQNTTQPGWIPFPHPYLTSKTSNPNPNPSQPPATLPPVPTWPFGASSFSNQSYTTSPSSFGNETDLVSPYPSNISAPTSTQDSNFLSPSGEGRAPDDEQRKLSSGGGVEKLAAGDDGGFQGFEGMLKQMSQVDPDLVPVGGEGDAGLLDSDSAQFLRDLLWPGWPAHLPCPTKLEHIIETFFNLVPWSTHLLNKDRFLARLSLPPRNSGFPHPALLHSICAVTARFIGGLDLVPPQVPIHPLDFGVPSGERNDLEGVPKPKWDGFGPKPAYGTTPGIDQDFGQVHFTWARLYAEQACNKPQFWLESTQALCFLSLYLTQVGMWSNAFGISSLMTRMALICGLNARPFLDRRTIKKPSMVPPPKDEIERIERQNLYWMVLSVDTFSCGASGWEGTLSISDAWIGIPTSKATFPSNLSPLPPSQFPDSDDLFTHHPPEHSSPFAITIKGTILLRRAGDFVRRSDLKGLENPRETVEFGELDDAISQLKDSSPSSISSPSARSTFGLSIDRDAVLAHALPFVTQIILHQRYWDGSDPIDTSLPKLREAIQGLLEQVHALSRTSFDFGLLQPFMVTAWYLGSRTLLSMLEVVLEDRNMSAVPSILQNIETFRIAMLRVGERLPFGHRQGTLVNTLLVDTLRPSSTLY